jgi:transcriptional regulator with XRE-family HTH domain
MAGFQSPTVRRRRLGHELRQIREAAGLTIDEVAKHLDISSAKLSRIETGRVGVRLRDVADLLDHYGIEGTHRENLLTLTREARQQGWWHSYTDVFVHGTDIWVGLESEAREIRIYEVQFVPGLLQTPEYSRALLRTHYPDEPPEQIERRVEFRLARQRLVLEEKQTPIWVVLDEAVLMRRMGPPEVMQRQLQRLLELSEKSNITIQVLPLDTGVDTGIPASFIIMRLPNPDPEVVTIEYRGGNLYLESADDVARHTRMYDLIRATAMGPGESVRYISQMAKSATD